MEIRIGKQSDAEQVQKIAYSAMHLLGLIPDPEGIDIELGQFGEKLDVFLLQLVAIVGDNVVGCISLRQLDACTGKLCGFYIDPAYRGRGIGKRLINNIIVYAKSTFLDGIYLETWDKMEAAVHLYSRFGWKQINDPPEESGAQRAYYLELTTDSNPPLLTSAL